MKGGHGRLVQTVLAGVSSSGPHDSIPHAAGP